MMVGSCQVIHKAQYRMAALFQQTLCYEYLGDWADRAGNAIIEQESLRSWMPR
jgi:type I restriction enzyme R subunit